MKITKDNKFVYDDSDFISKPELGGFLITEQVKELILQDQEKAKKWDKLLKLTFDEASWSLDSAIENILGET